jgi:glycosyltransferase involved in cell wall biosynthesis
MMRKLRLSTVPERAGPIGPQKVLFCVWALEGGGAERFLVELARRVPRERFEVKVVCLTRKGSFAPDLESAGVSVISLEKRIGLDPLILPRLIGLFRSERPAIVNTHLWTADLWARLAAVIARVPRIVVTEQNVDLWKGSVHRAIDRVLFLATDLVICVSDEVRAFYRELGVPESRMRVLPNAIDLAPFAAAGPREPRPGEPDGFVFLCVGRLHPQKGHAVLLDAVRLLCDSGERRFRLLLAGEGPLRQDLAARAEALGVAEHVHFLGFRSDVPDLLQKCDVMILPSLYEGLPLAVLEAMAAARPVIATQVGGNAGVLEHGVHGLLVPPQDASALAAAMGRLLGDPSGARGMGERGRSRVAERYDIDRVAAETYALFEECIGSNMSSPDRRESGGST